mmetsp:Transcript_6134/g.9393  ORF Transcript_6134/g.9393 Transcript_6134/m.9393 type:complete len:120 (-) Transcript_6134:92-451(-)
MAALEIDPPVRREEDRIADVEITCFRMDRRVLLLVAICFCSRSTSWSSSLLPADSSNLAVRGGDDNLRCCVDESFMTPSLRIVEKDDTSRAKNVTRTTVILERAATIVVYLLVLSTVLL